MGITFRTLTEITSTEPVQPWTAASIIARFYCGKLRLGGVCDNRCAVTCRTSILNIADNLVSARSPNGMLTWRAKNWAAKMLENNRAQERSEPVKKPVIFSEPKATDNPFEAFLEGL